VDRVYVSAKVIGITAGMAYRVQFPFAIRTLFVAPSAGREGCHM